MALLGAIMKILIVWATFALSGCVLIEAGDEKLAKAAIARDARDPESVIVRNVSKGVELTDGHVICGEWNAKNGFGGMGEWEGFTMTSNKGTLLYIQAEGKPDPNDTRALAKMGCPGVTFP